MTYARSAIVQFALIYAILTIIITMVVVSPTVAQSREETTPQERTKVRQFVNLVNNPSLQRSILAGLSGVAVEAGTAQDQARIRLARSRGASAYALTLSTPSSGNDFTDYGGIDGLAGDLKTTFSLSHHFYKGRIDPREVRERQEAICREAGIDVGGGGTCHDGAVRARSERLARAFVRQALPFKRIPVFSLDGAVGYRETTFFEPEVDTTEGQAYVSGSLSFSFGLLTADYLAYVHGRYENRVEDGDEATFCTPIEEPGLESCKLVPLGAPKRSGALVVGIGLRLWGRDAAIDPQVSWDITEGVVGIDLPVYLIRNASERFTGGVRFAWRSDDADYVAASVFVAAPLGLGL
jgi:hypothetical protein